jgi:hypothetical protein
MTDGLTELDAQLAKRENGSQPHEPESAPWPEPIGEVAYHGLAGKIVNRIKPETEADPSAMLVQALVMFGVVCGRNPHFRVEATRHGLNEFCVTVGESSKSRKGTGTGRVEEPILLAEPAMRDRRASGHVSGAGLIYDVRDPVITRRKPKTKAEREDAGPDGVIEEVEDEGEFDKRLLWVEEEFAAVIRAMARTGNDLMFRMLEAWDGHDLQNRARGSRMRATGPHIGLIGQMVEEELRRSLQTADLYNGFGNRILWTCSKRCGRMPFGGEQIHWAEVANELVQAIGWAKLLREPIGLSERAKGLWVQRYDELSAPASGLLGAVTSRAEAHVRRIAAIYAVMGRAAAVTKDHMLAAFEVWRYCQDSARYLFADQTGDQLADLLLEALRHAGARGMNRTEIGTLTGRNYPAERIDNGLMMLAVRQLAYFVRELTSGAPAQRWFAGRQPVTTTRKED